MSRQSGPLRKFADLHVCLSSRRRQTTSSSAL